MTHTTDVTPTPLNSSPSSHMVDGPSIADTQRPTHDVRGDHASGIVKTLHRFVGRLRFMYHL